MKLQSPAVVDEEGVSLSNLAVVVEVEPGNVIAMVYKAGVNVDWGLSRSRALGIQFWPELIASSEESNDKV